MAKSPQRLSLDELPLDIQPALRLPLASPWREAWFFDALESTQSFAADLVRRGAALHGIAIVAEQQLRGRGRTSKDWSSELGGLYVSAALPPARVIPMRLVGWLPLAAALACVQTLETQFGIHAKIKWPNDVLVNNCKIAGFLGELIQPQPESGKTVAATPGALVLGMGLNFRNQLPNNASQKFPATSVQEHFPELTDAGRIDFLRAWLATLGALHATMTDPSATQASLRSAVEHCLWHNHEQVTLEKTERGQLTGRLCGLNDLGGARIQAAGGAMTDIYCGWQTGQLTSNAQPPC